MKRVDLLDLWFRRKVTIVSALLILLVLVAAMLPAVRFGPARAVGAAVFSVSIEYFGVDAEEMERLVTIPLEDAISNLAGAQRLRSTSEYGKSVVEVTLAPSTSADHFYLALRDAVNTLYASLPKAAQRPEIQSSSSSQRPFFIATVTARDATLDQTRDLVEKTVKPALERIDGVGDLEVGGGSQREVHVLVDQKRATTAGLSFNAIAAALQDSYLERPIGRLRTGTADTPIILDGRFASLEQLADMRISLGGGGSVRLGDVSAVSYGGRETDTISRIDDDRRVTFAIKSSGTANVVSVSQALRRRIDEISSPTLSFDIVYDLGTDIEASIAEVLRSLAIAVGIVGLFVGLILRPARNAVLLGLMLPFVVLASAAILAASGFSIDHNILAGMGIGIGMIVDPGIIVLSALVGERGMTRAGPAAWTVKELIPPLLASTATIVIVLMPLLYIGRSVSGLAEVSVALAVMLSMALIVALLFLPAFAARGTGRDISAGTTRHGTRAWARRARRGMDGIVAWTGSHGVVALPAALGVCAVGLIAVLRMDVVLSPLADNHSIYAHVEFESGTTIDTIDRRTDWLARQVRALPGVTHVQSIARRESSEMTVTFTGSDTQAARVREALTGIGSQIPDSFVYIPEGASGTEQAIEVSLIGPDNDVLRATARKTAEMLRSQPWVSQVVLNFKDGPPAWVLTVNHDLVSEYGLSTSSIANTLRWGMYGPVALKWIEPDSREIDLRVRSSGEEREDVPAIQRIAVIGSQGRMVSVGQLGSFQLRHPPSRIFRSDRQRAVYVTVHSGIRNTALVLRKLEASLAGYPLPSGYAFRIDRSIYDGLRQLQTLSLLLVAALLLVFITLATQMESLSTPLLVMSVVPVSLSVPLAFLWLVKVPIGVPVIVSLIIMTGIIVNNAILVLDRTLRRCGKLDSWSPAEVRRSLRFAIRGRSRALFLTSATTILGIIPFLFGAGSGSALFRPLALVVFWGTLVSVGATFLLLPAIVTAAPVFARRFPALRR